MASRSQHPQVRALIRAGGEAYRTSRLGAVASWARKHSLFVLPFGGSCCGPELASLAGPRYDLESLGARMPGFSPRQSDLLMVLGTPTLRQAEQLRSAYEEMAQPKWVMAFGACACSGGPYDNYATLPGIDAIVPVDVYVPGCPPQPEAVLDGLRKLQARIQYERIPPSGRPDVAGGGSGETELGLGPGDGRVKPESEVTDSSTADSSTADSSGGRASGRSEL